MGTKLLKLSPIEVRGYRDPVAYFFGYDSELGASYSTFTIDAEADDLFSVWLLQWSCIAEQFINRVHIKCLNNVNFMPIGEVQPQVVIVNKYDSDQTNTLLCDTYINPLFCGWKRANTQYQLILQPYGVGAEETYYAYVRGFIYKELPDRI